MPAGMELTSEFAWGNAEQRCYEHLVTALEAQDGVTAFLEEYGKFAPDSEFWKFQFTNPTDAQVEPQPYWTFGAVFEGVYKSRASARRAWGRLVGVMAQTVNNAAGIEGLISMRFNPGEELNRVIMAANIDTGTEGGEVRRWILKQALTVNFVNSEPEISGESNDERNEAQA